MSLTTEQCRPVGGPDGISEARSSDSILPRTGPETLSRHDHILLSTLARDVLRSNLESLHRRVVQDMLTTAIPHYWFRRAREFEAARPTRAGDHFDAVRDQELAETAAACHEHGLVLLRYPDAVKNLVDDTIADLMGIDRDTLHRPVDGRC